MGKRKEKKEVYADIPNAFWNRKQHIVEIPSESDFNGRIIPINARS